MKFAFVGLLTTALGLGWFGLGSTTAPAGAGLAATSGSTCQATVECTPDGRCLVRCTGEDGQTCTVTLECNGAECRVVDCEAPAGECAPRPCASDAPSCRR